MPPATETFDLQATVSLVWQAMAAVVGHVGFQVGVHGLAMTLLLAIFAFFLDRAQRPTGKPLLRLSLKVGVFCLLLSLPGLLSLVATGKLPAVGSLQINSFALIGAWSLVFAHLIMLELNFNRFQPGK